MRLCALAASLSVCLCCSLSLAQETAVDKAKEYFSAGAQAYSVGQYTAAIQAFEQAHALAPRPAVIFSIAQAERRQYVIDQKSERLERAASLLRQYIEQVPQGGRRADAVQALSEIETLMARRLPKPSEPVLPFPERTAPTRVLISSPAAGVQISIDDGLPSESPLISEVSAGHHRVRVWAPGYFDEQRLMVAVEGALVTLDVPLRERPTRLSFLAMEGTRLYVDGRFQGEAPFAQPLELPAGKHVVAATRSGFAGVSRELSLARGQHLELRAMLPRSTQRTVSLMLLGASASTFVAGGVFAFIARNRDSAANSFLDRRGEAELSPAELEQYNSACTDRDRFRQAAVVAVGVSAALGITGGLLYFLDSPRVERQRPTPHPGATVRFVPGVAGLGPGVIGSF